MILRSKLSIVGLYEADHSLFANMVLPVGVDKHTLINNILSECYDLEVVYPDSDYMKSAIGFWSQSMLPNWNKVNDILNNDYDPLNSYRKHTVHEGEDNKNTTHEQEQDSTTVNSVKAYNEQTNFADYQKDVNNSSNNFERSENSTKNYERTTTGNIGIRSYQSLIEEEIDIRDRYNIYNIILKDFKRKFMLLVY